MANGTSLASSLNRYTLIERVDMKIVRKSSAPATNSSSLDSGHGPPLPVARRSPDRGYSEESTVSSFKSADFSRMSRHELHELINCQTRSGQLSLEGSATLTWLSINVRIDHDQSMESDEHEVVNFLDRAQFGMQKAHSENNLAVARQFEVALDLMHDIQGQTIGVDTLV